MESYNWVRLVGAKSARTAKRRSGLKDLLKVTDPSKTGCRSQGSSRNSMMKLEPRALSKQSEITNRPKSEAKVLECRHWYVQRLETAWTKELEDEEEVNQPVPGGTDRSNMGKGM